jgi:hypothetical protein
MKLNLLRMELVKLVLMELRSFNRVDLAPVYFCPSIDSHRFNVSYFTVSVTAVECVSEPLVAVTVTV